MCRAITTLPRHPGLDPGSRWPHAPRQPEEAGPRVKPGVTKEADLKAWLGEPDLTGVDEDGRPTSTWSRMAVDLSPSKSRVTAFFRLTVSWEGGVVKTMSFDRKAPEP